MQKLWYGSYVGAVLLICGCGGEAANTTEVERGNSAVQAQVTTTSTTGNPAATAPKKNLHPEVIISTTQGDITLRLDSEKAQLTVDNFLTYVDSGHYNGTIFHQVREGDIVLAGGFTEDLVEKPTAPPVRNEADNGLKNLRGTIALARQPDSIDSSTSQFFINLADNPHLDHHGRTPEEYGFCVFGKVTSGMDVLEKLSHIPVEDRDVNGEIFVMVPKQAVVIKSIRRK